jgi:fumarate reductase subunit C
MEKRGQYRKSSGTLWFLLNLIVGLYLLNTGLKIVDVSTFIPDIVNNWIIVIGGGLIILAAVLSLRRSPSFIR